MGLPLETFENMSEASTLPFPASSKQAAGEINGTKTDVTCISFADKIMITVTQHGRLAQWVCMLFVQKTTCQRPFHFPFPFLSPTIP